MNPNVIPGVYPIPDSPCPHAYTFLRHDVRVSTGPLPRHDVDVDVFYCVRCLEYKEKITGKVVKREA